MPNRPHPMAITAGNFYPSSPSRSDRFFPRKKKRIQIFHGAGCEGTRASVVVASVPPTDSELRIASLNDDSEALCWVWSRDQQVQVRCFYRDQPIRFCGHGLLASAYAWQTSHPDGTMPLTIRTATAACRSTACGCLATVLSITSQIHSPHTGLTCPRGKLPAPAETTATGYSAGPAASICSASAHGWTPWLARPGAALSPPHKKTRLTRSPCGISHRPTDNRKTAPPAQRP